MKKTVIRQGADDRGWVNIKGILYVSGPGQKRPAFCHETLHQLATRSGADF